MTTESLADQLEQALWNHRQPQGHIVSVAEAYQLGQALVSRYDDTL
jgi:hypothetical protein